MAQVYSVFLAIGKFLYDFSGYILWSSLFGSLYILLLIYTLRNHDFPQPRIWFDSEAYRQTRKRFADFIYLRLLTDIEKTEKKYSKCDSNAVSDETIQTAHEEMRSAIELFRSDAKKLLMPNELEISLPPQEVYGLAHVEEHLLRSFYGKIEGDNTEDWVKNLYYATGR